MRSHLSVLFSGVIMIRCTCLQPENHKSVTFCKDFMSKMGGEVYFLLNEYMEGLELALEFALCQYECRHSG